MSRTATTRRRGEGTGRLRNRRGRGTALRAKALFDPKPRPTETVGEPIADGIGKAGKDDRPERVEEVLLTAWAALEAGHPIECPVCAGTMTAVEGCTDCGSKLS